MRTKPRCAADAAQERVEGVLDVAVGREVVASRRRPGLQRRDGRLPVHGGVDAADLREARGLVERDRADLRVDALVASRRLLVGDRRIDVEAVDAAIAVALRRRAARARVPAAVERRAEARPAGVVRDAGPHSHFVAAGALPAAPSAAAAVTAANAHTRLILLPVFVTKRPLHTSVRRRECARSGERGRSARLVPCRSTAAALIGGVSTRAGESGLVLFARTGTGRAPRVRRAGRPACGGLAWRHGSGLRTKGFRWPLVLL